jgi:acyl-CoA thioesterase-1
VRRLRPAAWLPALLMLVSGCGSPEPSVVPAPGGSGARVVTFGDSVPAGTACDCTPFPDLYAARLGAASDNLAEPGLTSLDVRRQVTTAPASAAVRGANVVLVMAGANDLAAALDAGGGGSYAGPAADVQRNVTAVVESVRSIRPTAAVLVFGYWNVVEDGDVGRRDYGDDGVTEAAAATRSCDDALRRAAAATGAAYVDTTSVFKGDTGEQDPTGLLAADGDHPNAAGHRAIAQAAYRVLRSG